MTCRMDDELGAYVLDALDAAESEDVQRHLIHCQACRDEVRDLADTASLLALLTPQDIEQLYDRDLVGVGIERTTAPPPRPRRSRAALVLAAAAVTASVSVGAVRVLGGDHGRSNSSVARSDVVRANPDVVRVVDPTTHARAAITMTGRSWGTQLDLSLAGTYPSGWCSLVVHSRDGATDTAAAWVADTHGAATVAATTAIPTNRLSELDVLTDTGEVLVRIPVPARQLTPTPPTHRRNR